MGKTLKGFNVELVDELSLAVDGRVAIEFRDKQGSPINVFIEPWDAASLMIML